MEMIDRWVNENIDNLYSLNNEKHYLNAVKVRGHRSILKHRAIHYLLDEAEKVVLNKKIRRRMK